MSHIYVCENGHEVTAAWKDSAVPELCLVAWCQKPLKRKAPTRLPVVESDECCPACQNNHHARCTGKVKNLMCGCKAYDHHCRIVAPEKKEGTYGQRKTRRRGSK